MRARLAVRAAGLALAACAALTVTPAAATAATTPTGTGPHTTAGPERVHARAAAVAVAGSGRLLWSRRLNAERPVGSITKVMTALVVIQAGHLNRKITVPGSVLSYLRQYHASTAGLIPGDRLTASQLLAALLLPSGCDAAYVLARAYGPGTTAFIRKMNAAAKRLGMTRTHFSNFDGLPWPGEYSTYSTAKDLITLGRTAMRSAAFRAIVDRRSYRIAAGAAQHAYSWRNLNPLLGTYRGATGIKTGYTLAAGRCLLFAATRHGRSLVGVTLASPGHGTTVNGTDPARVLNWAFSLPSS